MQLNLEHFLLKTYQGNKSILEMFPDENSSSFIHSVKQRLVSCSRSKKFPFDSSFLVMNQDRLIGYFYISSLRNDEVYLESFILEQYRGQGLGTLLLGEISDFLLAHYNIRSIVLDIDPSNIGSAKTALSCGFMEDIDDFDSRNMNGRILFRKDNWNYVAKNKKGTKFR